MFRRLAVALVAFVVACSGSGRPNPTTTLSTPLPTVPTPVTRTVDDGFPVTVEAGKGSVTLDARPTAVLSLSPTATEILFGIGAGDQVTAVDSLSNFPAEAPVTGLSAFQPNVEAIATFNPDLVVISFDPGDVVASLNALEIAVILQPTATSLADAYDQIIQLGTATGNVEEAETLIESMRTEVEEIVASVGSFEVPPTYYHEIDATLYTVTSSTFIGEIYGLLGLENVADAADPDGFGYPQLSAEFLLQADPDLIFLADVPYGESAATVEAREGWESLSAVKQGAIVELDADISSRWGPRIVEFLRTVALAVQALE